MSDPHAFIKALYAERGRKKSNGSLAYFSRSSKDMQKGVANRFAKESKDALAMVGTGGASSSAPSPAAVTQAKVKAKPVVKKEPSAVNRIDPAYTVGGIANPLNVIDSAWNWLATNTDTGAVIDGAIAGARGVKKSPGSTQGGIKGAAIGARAALGKPGSTNVDPRSLKQQVLDGAKIASSKGYRVDENKFLGNGHVGKHGAGSSHYDGRGFDINHPKFGSGKYEARDPTIRAEMDEIKNQYLAAGYNVIWNGFTWYADGTATGKKGPATGGHENHMHVNIPSGGLKPANGSVNRPTITVAGNKPSSGSASTGSGVTVNRGDGGIGAAIAVQEKAFAPGEDFITAFRQSEKDRYAASKETVAYHEAQSASRAKGASKAGSTGDSGTTQKFYLAIEDAAISALLMRGLQV